LLWDVSFSHKTQRKNELPKFLHTVDKRPSELRQRHIAPAVEQCLIGKYFRCLQTM